VTRRDDLYNRAAAAFRRGEAAQWEAAEAMADLYAMGESQRQIAERLACGHKTVGRYVSVWQNHGPAGPSKRPSFSDALAEVRDYSAERNVPRAPEKRAALVAELLKDKAVADDPQVRKVEERHVDRRLKAEMATFNREHQIPTRSQENRDNRRLFTSYNRNFWGELLIHTDSLIKRYGEAASELERTGLPRERSGEIIRKARALARAVERFDQAATSAGVGKAM
jgi:transposase